MRQNTLCLTQEYGKFMDKHYKHFFMYVVDLDLFFLLLSKFRSSKTMVIRIIYVFGIKDNKLWRQLLRKYA